MSQVQPKNLSIREIFDANRDPLRNLNTIIKVQDTSQHSLWVEFEEFVLTDTLLEYLSIFLSEFCESTVLAPAKMPIWLEGFYGSGKSHFAKIIGLLLMNRELVNPLNQRFTTVDYFLNHILNEIQIAPEQKKLMNLRNQMVDQLTIYSKKIKTQTIFINLAKYSKSESATATHLESFTYAVMTEFNAILGLSDEIETAEIERALMHDNLYDKFKEEVQNTKNKSWEEIRQSIPRARTTFKELYGKIYACPDNLAQSQAQAYIDGAVSQCKQRNIEKVFAEMNVWAKEKYPSDPFVEGRVILILDEAGLFFSAAESRLGELQTAAEWVHNPTNESRIQMIFTAQQSLQKHIEESRLRVDFKKVEQRFKQWILGKENIKTVVVKRWLKKDQGSNGQILTNLIDTRYPDIIDGITFQTIMDPKRDYVTPKREDIIVTYPLLPYQFPLMIQVSQKLIEKKIVQEEYGGRTRSVLSMTRDILQNKAPFSLNTHFIEDDLGEFVNLAQIYDSIIYTLRRQEEDQTSLVEATTKIKEDTKIFTSEEQALKISFSDVAKAVFLFQFVEELYCNEENLAKALYYSLQYSKTVYSSKIKKLLEILLTQGHISNERREINDGKETKEFWQYKIATTKELDFTKFIQKFPCDLKMDLPEIFAEYLKSVLGKDLFNFKDQLNITTLYGKAGKSYTLKNAFKLKVEWFFDPDFDEVLGKIGDDPGKITVCLLTNRSLYDPESLKVQTNLQTISSRILILSKKAFQKKQMLLFITPAFSQTIDTVFEHNKKIIDLCTQIFRIKKGIKEYAYDATIIPIFTQRQTALQKDLLKLLKEEWGDGMLFSGDGQQTRLNKTNLDSSLLDSVQQLYSKVNPHAYLGQVKLTQDDIKAVLTWDAKKALSVSKALIKPPNSASGTKNELESLPIFTELNDLQPNMAEVYNFINVEFQKELKNNTFGLVSADVLFSRLTSSPYSWKEYPILVVIAAMLRNNEWEAVVGADIKNSNDPKLIEAFMESKDNFGKFRQLSFRIAEKLDQEQLILAAKLLKELFANDIPTPGYDAIDAGIREVLTNFSTLYLEIKPDLVHFFKAEAENTQIFHQTLQEILTKSRMIERIRAFLTQFSKELESNN